MSGISVIAKRTFADMATFRRTFLYIAVVLLVPFLFAGAAEENHLVDTESLPLGTQGTLLVGYLSVLMFIWVAGVPLIMLTISSCAGFISGEENGGTLLLLVSKPIERHEIVLGRYIGFVTYMMLVQTGALIAVPYMWFLTMELEYDVLRLLLGMVPMLLVYSLFVILVWGAVSIALSAITKRTAFIIMGLGFFAMVTFLGFIQVRAFTMASGLYEDYSLHYVDAGYHFGNMFVSLVEGGAGIRIPPDIQMFLGTFTGAYDVTKPFMDPDQGLMFSSLPRNDLVSPARSFATSGVLALSLLGLGVLLFRYKEVH
jgi:ABC-type transport system involved in multi-copper enzyme maturation permease subunit